MDRAIIENGVIVNVIVVNEGVTEHDGKTLYEFPPHAGIGWTWDGMNFSPPGE